jgi:hypothetical protein
MLAKYFALLVGILMVAGAPPYLKDILKGKTRPERATWFIWSVLGVVAFVAQMKLHGRWSLIFVGVDAIGNILVFCLSLKLGIAGWSITDRIAIIIAAIAIAVSLISRQPVVALTGVILADLSGSALTIIKTYKQPESETSITWILLGTASLLGALSVGRLDWQLLLYPVYLTIATYGVFITQVLSRTLHPYSQKN